MSLHVSAYVDVDAELVCKPQLVHFSTHGKQIIHDTAKLPREFILSLCGVLWTSLSQWLCFKTS